MLRAVFRTTFSTRLFARLAAAGAAAPRRDLEGIAARDGDAAEAATRTLIGDTAAAVGRSAKRQRRINTRP